MPQETDEPDFDPFDFNEDEEEREPDYYLCSCCGNTQLEPGMGNSCNRCGMFHVMSEEYY